MSEAVPRGTPGPLGAETMSPALQQARNYYAWIADQFRVGLGKRVLDVGGGHGSHLDHIVAPGRFASAVRLTERLTRGVCRAIPRFLAIASAEATTPRAMRPRPPSFSLANTKTVSPAAICLPPYIVFCAVNANVFARGSQTPALIANAMLLHSTRMGIAVIPAAGPTRRIRPTSREKSATSYATINSVCSNVRSSCQLMTIDTSRGARPSRSRARRR